MSRIYWLRTSGDDDMLEPEELLVEFGLWQETMQVTYDREFRLDQATIELGAKIYVVEEKSYFRDPETGRLKPAWREMGLWVDSQRPVDFGQLLWLARKIFPEKSILACSQI